MTIEEFSNYSLLIKDIEDNLKKGNTDIEKLKKELRIMEEYMKVGWLSKEGERALIVFKEIIEKLKNN